MTNNCFPSEKSTPFYSWINFLSFFHVIQNESRFSYIGNFILLTFSNKSLYIFILTYSEFIGNIIWTHAHLVNISKLSDILGINGAHKCILHPIVSYLLQNNLHMRKCCITCLKGMWLPLNCHVKKGG